MYRGSIKQLVAIALLAMAVGVSGCGSDNGSGQAPKVVASNSQLLDLVSKIGAGAVNVTGMAPAAVNPHTWMPPSDSAATLKAAKIVFHNGGDLEPWFDPIVGQSNTSATVVDLSKSAKLIGKSENANAHWATDPRNAILAAKTVAAQLTKANPAAGELYKQNLAKFEKDASDLDTNLLLCTSRPAKKKMRVIAAHDDLGYLTARYEFKVVAKLVPSGADTPTQSDIDAAVSKGRAGGAAMVLNPWSEVDAAAGAVAQRLGITKSAVFTDALSDLTAGAKSLLGSIAYTVGLIVQTASNGKYHC
jgi:ABC-type Zn uptake system ZnuABC Zn-binding protein ZnuA